MELNNIFELWDRFESSPVDEMELEMNGIHFSLKKSSNVSSVAPSKNTNISQAPQTVAEEVPTIEKTGVTAPLVGVFYSAPSPDAAPFVKVGDTVSEGDVVCIIEAMKLMNEVKSPVSGTVKDILISDESMVEYGQMLIVIE